MPIFSWFGADFFTVYADSSRFVRDISGEKKKNISLSMSFFTVSFSRFAPSRLPSHRFERSSKDWKKGKDPHPQDKIQHLDFTKDPRPLYYKTPLCALYHKNVRSKAVFGS